MQVRRWYGATATATDASTRHPKPRTQMSSRLQKSRRTSSFEDGEPSSSSRPPLRSAIEAQYAPQPRIPSDATPLVEHLGKLFARDFPPNLAKQMLTHISAREAWEGHNARLAFLGEALAVPILVILDVY